MSSKKIDLPPGMTLASASRKNSGTKVTSVPAASPKSAPLSPTGADELLLVCIQDPFDGVAKESSLIVDTLVPASDNNSDHRWRLRAVLEMNPDRFFESWATRGSFVLNLTVRAGVSAQSGAWGGSVDTFTQADTCRITVMRSHDNRIHFSLDSGANHATEKSLPSPDKGRFLNADIAFLLNGSAGVTACAAAVISNRNWSRLISGSSATTKGLSFDGNWRTNLEKGDGDSISQGRWAFALMPERDYLALCKSRAWADHIVP